ncbi:MAG: GYD domain-containing protein [Anaerolineales bacterium]|nr:GYD domain-containing protein [Anaerolineales bacterium]
MGKNLCRALYTTEGVKGLLKEGGTSRRAMVENLVRGMGGTLEAVYFAFGDDDVYLIVDVPDNVTSTAFSLVVNASGAVNVKTTVLLTPEEIDEAAKLTVDYRPPGQ